jgi:hypothetical protein
MIGPEDLCASYGRAVAGGDGAEIARHYVFPYVSFTSGRVNSFTAFDEAVEGCNGQIGRFMRVGLGRDIRLTAYKVVPVSENSALCHLSWEVVPANGLAPWTWLNIYGYRRRGDAEGFEFNISDNEMGELLQRVPDFFSR